LLGFIRRVRVEVSDEALIERCKRGDKEGFEELVNRYQTKVYNLNLRLCGGDREEAEDLTQEVFISAYQGLSKYQARGKFFTWLYRIAVNTFNASHRRKPCVAPEPLEDWEDKIVATDTPEEKLLLKEIQEICFSAIITHIPKSERVVFVLSETQGLSNKEIGEILGITEGAVKARLHRAREKVIGFFRDRCELIRKKNPCKCRMWRDYAKEQVRCLPEEMKEEPIVIDVETIDKNLNDLQKITLFYRSLSKKELSGDVLSKIRQKIEEGEIFCKKAYLSPPLLHLT
jgi:RNA polymerase sigma-70 factor (ECF subfamily)